MRYTEENIFSREKARGDSTIRKSRTVAVNGKGRQAMSGYARMLKSISGLAENLQALNQQAVRTYTPIMETILSSSSRDVHHIEHTLDGLLSFCGHEPALQLYKKLCRHYFSINPVATAEYVHAYREMWDSDQKAKQWKAKKLRGKKGEAV